GWFPRHLNAHIVRLFINDGETEEDTLPDAYALVSDFSHLRRMILCRNSFTQRETARRRCVSGIGLEARDAHHARQNATEKQAKEFERAHVGGATSFHSFSTEMSFSISETFRFM